MSGLKEKREQIVKAFRQQNRQKFREGLRNKLVNSLCGNEPPLISSVLQMFWGMTHFELTQSKQKILEVLQSTNFQQLTDQEHQQIVTDLFYLMHQQILQFPTFLKFKKNQNGYTASLVAYLSAEIDTQELIYWLNYMSEDDRRLTISLIEEKEYQQAKWVSNKPLFLFLLQELKYCAQASEIVKQMLLNCQQISKKDVDESVHFIIKAIQYSHQHSKEEVRVSLLSLFMTTLQIYFKIKQNRAKLMQMVTLLKKQLSSNLNIFLKIDILCDLNKLYQQEPDSYLQNDDFCPEIVSYTLNNLNKIEEAIMSYYLNNLFRLFYNNWLVKQLLNKNYRYSQQVYYLFQQFPLIANNAWYIKLCKIIGR